MTYALIGGTGLTKLEGLVVRRSHAIDTPYGPPSMAIEEGEYAGQSLYFLHRHGGQSRHIPPHCVNYRANIWALAELGATRIIGANAVGAVNPELRPGKLVVPDQLIDYTWGREHSFSDGSDGTLQHIDFTEPYDAALRLELIAAAQRTGVACVPSAVMAVVQGPRLETAAEVRRLAQDGCDLVGMTGMPEAALAREIGLAYAAVCMNVNAAAGLQKQPIRMESIRETVRQEALLLSSVLDEILRKQTV